jgi:hypothetical protein
MKKLADITALKSWPKLQKLGFKKIKFTFQGLAYSYGAEKTNPTITIEPHTRYNGLEWQIHKEYGKTKYVKGPQILKTVEEML